MYRDNEVISKINPEMLARAEYIQGDGSPGSLRLFKLGPGIYIYMTFSSLIYMSPFNFGSFSCWTNLKLFMNYFDYHILFSFVVKPLHKTILVINK